MVMSEQARSDVVVFGVEMYSTPVVQTVNGSQFRSLVAGAAAASNSTVASHAVRMVLQSRSAELVNAVCSYSLLVHACEAAVQTRLEVADAGVLSYSVVVEQRVKLSHALSNGLLIPVVKSALE